MAWADRFLPGGAGQPARPDGESAFGAERRRMVERDLAGRGIRDPRVLEAMGRVPRELFVPESLRHRAYDDCPLDIGRGQTISQPYMVALMSEALAPRPGERVLEIGAGSGYQTAILLELGARVWAVELLPELAHAIEPRLRALGYDGFKIVCRDGWMGWPEEAPFDAMIVAAAPPELPPALFEQGAPGCRIVAPIGWTDEDQILARWRLGPEGWSREDLMPVRFVPLVHPRGEAPEAG